MNTAAREVDKRVTRAIIEYGLIQSGDRILLAVSGGKDSIAMAWNLAGKSRGFPVQFSVEALHLVTDFSDGNQSAQLEKLLAGWNLKVESVQQPVSSGTAAGVVPDCYSCARIRRRMLLEYALANGFNKIALGHHMNDAVATLLMNMTYKAELATMPPLVPSAENSPSIIRPLILCQESLIERLVRGKGWETDRCSCPWAGDSRRSEMAAVIEHLTGGSAKKLWNIWRSLSNPVRDLLP